MQVTYFTLFLLLKTIFVLSTFLLARLLLKSDKIALLATLALAFTHFMGAEQIGVSEAVSTGFAFSFIPLIFYVFLKDAKKFSVPAFASLGVLTYFHVITALPAVLALSALLLWMKEKKELAVSFAVFAVISVPFFLSMLQSEAVDTASLKIAAPYYTLEDSGGTILKYAPLMLLGFAAAYKRERKASVLMAGFAAYASLSVLLLFSDALLPYTFFRAARFVVFFAFIYSTLAVFGMWKTKSAVKVLAFMLIWIPFSSINYSNLPGAQDNSYDPDTVQIGTWLDANTGKDTLILAPPDAPSLRVWSKRSVVSSNADLWLASVRPSIGDELARRISDVNRAYRSGSFLEINGIAMKYGADYIVAGSDEGGNPLFVSGRFGIYRPTA